MSESTPSARKRFLGTLALIVAVTTVISAVVFFSLGPIRLGGSPAAANTRPAFNTSDRSIPRREFSPPPADPFTALTDPKPEVREQALLPRGEVDLWLDDPRTTPAMRRGAAERLVNTLADENERVRTAAVTLVGGLKTYREFVPVYEKMMAEKDTRTQARGAELLWRMTASDKAGKRLVELVTDRTAHVEARVRAAGVTRDVGSVRPDGMAGVLMAVLADRTDATPVRWAALDQFKADRMVRRPQAAGVRDALVKVVRAEDDQDMLRAAALQQLALDFSQSQIPDDLRPTVVGLAADQKVFATLRDAAFNALTGELRDGQRPDDTTRLFERVTTDTSSPADLRARAFDQLASGLRPGEVPAPLRPTVAKVAADTTHAEADRIRAFTLLEPSSASFAKSYQELATLLEQAVSDDQQGWPFRTFAAGHYRPDTADKFATAVEQATGGGDAGFTTALAAALDRQFPDGKPPPKEWLTAKVVERIAGTATPSARLNRLFTDALLAAGPGVVPKLAAGLTDARIRHRNLTVLAKFGADAKPAAAQVYALLGRADLTADEAKLVNRLVDAFGPEELVNRLKAKGTRPEEQTALLDRLTVKGKEWLPLLIELLGHEGIDVRTWAAERIGRIGPDAKTAIPKVVERLKADIETDRHSYVTALAGIGPDSLPAVTELTRDKNPHLRRAAVEVFGLLGPEVRSKATPILRTAIEEDADDSVQRAALDALGQVNPVEARKLGWSGR